MLVVIVYLYENTKKSFVGILMGKLGCDGKFHHILISETSKSSMRPKYPTVVYEIGRVQGASSPLILYLRYSHPILSSDTLHILLYAHVVIGIAEDDVLIEQREECGS